MLVLFYLILIIPFVIQTLNNVGQILLGMFFGGLFILELIDMAYGDKNVRSKILYQQTATANEE